MHSLACMHTEAPTRCVNRDAKRSEALDKHASARVRDRGRCIAKPGAHRQLTTVTESVGSIHRFPSGTRRDAYPGSQIGVDT